MKKHDFRNILILLSLGLSIILGILLSNNIFGANMDWINQHTVIPEYFRNYFYKTGKLIPDIIYNLGLGQNAFNFSYYGLLSPIILLSYLFPFLNMTTYIIISSIIIYLLSIYLFYRFLKPKFDIKLTTLLTLIFTCASPVLFHFHRQVMFVNYLPFLIMALINIDNYQKISNKIFLVLNILCMIFTSYYFSVSGILVIFIYYIFVNFEEPIKNKFRIVIPIVISILISSILLLPSLLAILNGRVSGENVLNLVELFIPNFNYSSILYGSYALGLFSIFIISIVYLILNKDKKFKFLGITLLVLITFPIFRYLLNGGLYVRSKILIPFIPMFILILGVFLNDLFTQKIELKKLMIPFLILLILGLLNFHLVYYLDLIATMLILLIYVKFKKSYIIVIPLILLSIITIVTSNIDEDYVSLDEYQTLTQNQNIIDKLLETDASFYRVAELDNTLYNVNRNFLNNHYKTSVYSSTINNNYKSFYYDVLKLNNNNYNNLILRDTNNIIFNSLVGVKYIISDNELGYGYSKISDKIYQNDYALSLGYASNNIYSLELFNNTKYPYNLKYLMNGIVVDEGNFNEIQDIVYEYDFDLLNSLLNKFPYEIKDGAYYIEVAHDDSFDIELDAELDNKLLFITIEGLESNSCSIDDISISINNQGNSLSCSSWLYHNQNYNFNYLINEEKLNKLNIFIKKGTYKIDSIKLYTMDIKYLSNNFDQMFNINIYDNKITGEINVTSDGYMTLTLPFDNSFNVFVDGKQVDFEMTNTAFIGFKVTKGYHNIEIVYKAKGLVLGSWLSGFGLLLFGIYLIMMLKSKNKFVKIK